MDITQLIIDFIGFCTLVTAIGVLASLALLYTLVDVMKDVRLMHSQQLNVPPPPSWLPNNTPAELAMEPTRITFPSSMFSEKD